MCDIRTFVMGSQIDDHLNRDLSVFILKIQRNWGVCPLCCEDLGCEWLCEGRVEGSVRK